MTAVNLRRLKLALAYALLALPVIIFGAVHSLDSNLNSPIDWVPHSFAPRADYDSFCELFGTADTVLASWVGCTVDERCLDALENELRTSPKFRGPDGKGLFHQVVSGRDLVMQLVTGPAGISQADAIRRFRGTWIGPDDRTTCLVIAFTPEALEDRAELVPRIQRAIEAHGRIAAKDLYLAGPVMDGLSVDQASQASLGRLALPSAIVVMIVSCVCLRSLRGGLFVFALAIYCQAAVLAIVYFCGETMSALLIVLPPLIQVLAVAGGVHLTNYYFDARSTYSAEVAPREALRLGWLPCALSAGTTALGLASLAASQLAPIRSFGAFGAAGVLLTVGLLLPILPVLWWRWPLPRRVAPSARHDRPPAFAARWTGLIHRNRWPIVASAGVLAAVFGSHLGKLQTSVRIETLFPSSSRLVRDYCWIEEHVGKVVPIEIVVTCDADCPLSLRDKFALVGRIGREASRSRFCSGTQSAVQFLPAFPDRSAIAPQTYAVLLDEGLRRTRQAAIDAGQLRSDAAGEHWRVTMFVGALDDLNYSDFLAELANHVEPLLRGERGEPLPGVSVRYTGIMPLVHAIQERMLRDLSFSFLMAFFVILLVVVIAQAGVAAGVVTMIPNVFPTVMLFGWFGWSRTEIDIGTVMTASAALGIAVDDTFHFLSFFRRALEGGQTRLGSVELALRHCGPAMIQTSLICGLGLAVFAFSDFTPTRRFAQTMIIMFGLALAGDLILLPALLLGPAGRWFGSPTQRNIGK